MRFFIIRIEPYFLFLIPDDMPIIKPIIRQIDKEETLRYAGLSRNKDWQPQLLDDACSELLLVSQPLIAYEILIHEQGRISDYQYHSAGLSKHLGDCKQVVVLAASLGKNVDECIERLFSNDEYTKGLLINAAATALIEQCANYLTDFLYRTKFARGGQYLGSRFSPGYSDWPLEAQRDFFPLTEAAKIGIELTQACSLNPKKSITAVMPVIHNSADKTSCFACANANCEYRQSHT